MPYEVYPNAPVQFVTFGLQYALTPALDRTAGKEAVYEQLSGDFPLLESLNTMQVQLAIGPDGQSMPLPSNAGQQVRMTNRSRTASVTVGPTGLAVESANHEAFASLIELIERVLVAVSQAATVRGVERIALHYVDEIRHPRASTPGDWSGLVQESLLGPIDLLSEPAAQTEGGVSFQVSDQHALRLVYGAHPTGFTVDPNGPLRVRSHELGPFFRLDTESVWMAKRDDVPPLVVNDVVAICHELHEPISRVLEAAITDQLRTFFRSPDVR